MLRGDVPLKAMEQAMPHRLKAMALKTFGKLYVPTVPIEAGFFRTISRRIIQEMRTRVPSWHGCVIAVGGLDSIEIMEAALDEGFGAVQAARALIRDPNLVHKATTQLTTDSRGTNEADETNSKIHRCIHCNMCVVATLNPNKPMSCPERLNDGEYVGNW